MRQRKIYALWEKGHSPPYQSMELNPLEEKEVQSGKSQQHYVTGASLPVLVCLLLTLTQYYK